MADWTASFTIPKYTTAGFRKLRADYIAKHGYQITVPGLYDIIKIPIEKPITKQEAADWKARKWGNFSEDRLYEIRRYKKKRKDKFLAMLASPAPEIIKNAGAFMTAIDNAQDALFTIGGLGALAMRFSPPPVAAAIALPTGVAMTGANALNVIQSLGTKGLPGIKAKRMWQKKTKIDPWSKKGRVKYAKHLQRKFPTKAFAIQALQVTNDVFGVGLCLGPVVGLFIDSIAGPVRRMFGDKVTVKYPVPTYSEFCEAAQYYGRQAAAYFYPGPQTKDEEIIGMMIAHWLSQVALYSETKDQPGWTNYNNIEELELQMPLPTNILTLEVMEEEGIKPEDVCNWPHSGKRWASTTEIAKEYEKPCQDFFDSYMAKHDKDWIGHIFKTLACDAHFYTMAIAEGEDQVETDYTVTSKVCSKLLERRLYPAPEQSANKIQQLADKIDFWEKINYNPTTREIVDFCENFEILLTTMSNEEKP